MSVHETEELNLAPETLMESPMLLTPEVLHVLVVKHARDESL